MLVVRRVSSLVLLGVLAMGVGRASEEGEARDAAEKWLALVDGADYAESWEQAASYFKGQVAKAQWETMAAKVREPMGELQSREFMAARKLKKLPGAPDGDYVVIRYRAYFANKASAVETVTPMLDTDGRWRVSGYFVK